MMRVRSKACGGWVGTAYAPFHGVHPVLWDNGSWSYLYDDEFVVIS